MAGRDEKLLVAKVNAFAVRLVLHAGGFGEAVEFGGEELEADDVVVAEPVLVTGGEVAVDAMFDLDAGGVDRDGFADQEGAVGFECDVAVEVEDAFAAISGGRRTVRRSRRGMKRCGAEKRG